MIQRYVLPFTFYLSLAFVIYMPLHVFIVQSASLLTGGLEVWKAAKDVLLFALVPLLLFLAWRKDLFRDKHFRLIVILSACYAFLHLLFVLFDQNDDTYSTIVASVYNTRLMGYFLLGYVALRLSKTPQRHLKILMTAAVLVSSLVALFGVMQYFLPPDLLENVGYSLERGVKPLFFIDDRPELPRVMSTLKDPNSLGAYLILPILALGYSLKSRAANKQLFIRPLRRETLSVLLAIHLFALWLTFSRGALLGLAISSAVLVFLISREKLILFAKKFGLPLILTLIFSIGTVYAARNSAFVQDYVLHAAVSTDEQDPNAKRVSLQAEALEDIAETPLGEGPGSAGLVAITNPKGGLLTENYYLQVAYEVGWLGLALFVAIIYLLARQLQISCNKKSEASSLAVILLASLAGLLFYSLLIHLWSNEAIALQWWLLTGAAIGSVNTATKSRK